MQKLSFGIFPQKNTLKNKVDENTKLHPVATPLIATSIAGVAGAGLGYVLPVTQDAFINHSIFHKSDKLIQHAHDAYSIQSALAEQDVDSLEDAQKFIKKFDDKFNSSDVKEMSSKLNSLADGFMYDIRIMLGKDAFNKVASEIKNEKMYEKGKKVFDIVADEKQHEIKEQYKAEFQEYTSKKLKKIPEHYDEIFKSVRKCNSKVVGLVLGLSTAVVSGLYSRSMCKKNKS